MNTEVLEELGLSRQEINIYMTLLELGPTTAGAVLDRANIQNSVFHSCINRLLDKGLVSYIKKNSFRVYSATDPEQFINIIKEKEKSINKLIPKLKERQTFAKPKEEAELFEGIKGVMTLLNILIKDSNKGDDFLFFAPEYGKDKDIQDFYRKYDAKRKAKGLIVKGIAPHSLKKHFKGRKSVNMKFSKIPIPANQGICGDKMVIISWGDKPSGVLIRSENIIERQREFFLALWGSINK